MTINNITQLRNFALDQLTKLGDNEIDVSQAGAAAKLCETVVSSIKSELEYARMTNQTPRIPFMITEDGTDDYVPQLGAPVKRISHK